MEELRDRTSSAPRDRRVRVQTVRPQHLLILWYEPWCFKLWRCACTYVCLGDQYEFMYCGGFITTGASIITQDCVPRILVELSHTHTHPSNVPRNGIGNYSGPCITQHISLRPFMLGWMPLFGVLLRSRKFSVLSKPPGVDPFKSRCWGHS